jgi:hypothetical protein
MKSGKRYLIALHLTNNNFLPLIMTILTPFQKIIVIKAIRSDKVIPCIQDFVSLTMG